MLLRSVLAALSLAQVLPPGDQPEPDMHPAMVCSIIGQSVDGPSVDLNDPVIEPGDIS